MQEIGRKNGRPSIKSARRKHLRLLEKLQEARMEWDQAQGKTRKSKLQGLIDKLQREAEASVRKITELKHQGRR